MGKLHTDMCVGTDWLLVYCSLEQVRGFGYSYALAAMAKEDTCITLWHRLLWQTAEREITT